MARTKEDVVNVSDIAEGLSKLQAENGDIYDALGILVLDVADLVVALKTEGPLDDRLERADALSTLIQVGGLINGLKKA